MKSLTMLQLKITLALLAAFAQISEQTRCQTFKLGENIVGVGTNQHLYIRRSTSNKFSWVQIPQSCCVTQIHIMKNGQILGVGRNRHIYIKKNLFAPWRKMPHSCCVKDVTTFRARCNGRRLIVGVGMNGKLYSKVSFNSRWVGPYRNSGTVIAVAGVTGTLYGIGTNKNIYKRPGLNGVWTHIPGSCCVKDIHVSSEGGHYTYGVGTNNRLYTTSLQHTSRVRWSYKGAHTCCVRSVAVQKRSVNVKIIGVGNNKQLYVKPTLSSGWAHVSGSGSVTDVTVLNDGLLVGIGTNRHLYYRTNIDDRTWKHVPHSCCVKSITQLKSGLIIGVGTRNTLWVRAKLFSKWSWNVPNSGSVTKIAAGPNGELIGIGLNRRLYKRSCFTSRWTGPLKNSGQTIDVAFDSDGRLYGIGNKKRIYRKTSTSLTSAWRILPRNNCCVIGLAVR